MTIKNVTDVQSRGTTQKKSIPVTNDKVKLNTKYVDKLIEIHERSALEANEIGFIARFLIQATLPHSKPRLNEWSRKNGNLTMHMMAAIVSRFALRLLCSITISLD